MTSLPSLIPSEEVEDSDYDSDDTALEYESQVGDDMWEKDLDDTKGSSEESCNQTNNTSNRLPPQKKNWGGVRNVNSYEKKMQCLDVTAVRTFLQTVRCGCENNCIGKLHLLGAQGELVTNRIRQARFSGMNASTANTNSFDILCI